MALVIAGFTATGVLRLRIMLLLPARRGAPARRHDRRSDDFGSLDQHRSVQIPPLLREVFGYRVICQ